MRPTFDTDQVALLLDAVESQTDAVIVFDRDAAIQYANAAAMAMVDSTLDEVRGQRVRDLVTLAPFFMAQRDFFQTVDQVLTELIADGGYYADDDGARLSLTGEAIPVSSRMLAVRRGDEVIGAVWVLRDQTQDSSLMFRRAAVAMVHVTRTGAVREANEAFVQLLDREHGELRGSRFLDLVHPDDLELAVPIMEDVLARRSTAARAELRVVRRDGSLRWAELSVAPNGLGSDDGQGIGGACVILQDVTERVELQQELEAAQERLRQLAHHDPLTGLPNRTLLTDELHVVQERAASTGTHMAVLFVDLDGFKQVNDGAGHDAGDRLLVQVGARLRGLLRPADMAARLGGDEFVLSCADLGPDTEVARARAEQIAGRVREALGAPFEIDGREWTLGASVGIALSGVDGDDAASLLRAADAEMYRGKTDR